MEGIKMAYMFFVNFAFGLHKVKWNSTEQTDTIYFC